MAKDKLSAETILRACDRWRRQLYPAWELERLITSYANGGPPPNDDDTCEDEIVPLGFANTFMRKEMAPLLDPLTQLPGFIDAKLTVPAIKLPERTSQVQMALNEELNKVAMERVKPTMIAAAGKATVTGRAYIYRKSPNDFLMRSGRMLHPQEAGIDILDSSFREWGFMDKLSLRDIESMISSSSPSKYGWNKAGLENLKIWIMASEAQKYKDKDRRPEDWMNEYDRDTWLAVDLVSTVSSDPVDVYWYWRKTGKVTSGHPRFGGHEEVDLYCVSRFGSAAQVEKKLGEDNWETKGLAIKYGESDPLTEYKKTVARRSGMSPEEQSEHDCNERLLFHFPARFKSASEALILHIDDAKVSGDQNLVDVQGTGKTAMPKLAVMESLLMSLIEGLSFGAQINWTVAPGVEESYLEQLSRGGIRSGQPFPPGIQPMQKNNTFTGFGPAMSAIRMLDTGISADSAASNQGNFGGSQQEFAAQAQAELAGRAATAGQRMGVWLITLDKVCEWVGRTLCREWTKQRQAWPSYHDAARMRLNLSAKWKIHEDEWDADRWDFVCRRLAGNMMKQEALIRNTQILETVGPHVPEVIPFACREIMRVIYGDTITAQIMNPDEQELKSQTESAQLKVASAFINGQAPTPKPNDNPMKHAEVASLAAQNHIKAAMQAGVISQTEVVGITAVIAYAVANVAKLPEQIAKPAMEQFARMGKALQSIPVQQPPDDSKMTEKEMAEVQIKQMNQQRLSKTDELKAKKFEFDQMAKMKQLSDNEEMRNDQMLTTATQRAKTIHDISSSLAESDAALPAGV